MPTLIAAGRVGQESITKSSSSGVTFETSSATGSAKGFLAGGKSLVRLAFRLAASGLLMDNDGPQQQTAVFGDRFTEHTGRDKADATPYPDRSYHRQDSRLDWHGQRRPASIMAAAPS